MGDSGSGGSGAQGPSWTCLTCLSHVQEWRAYAIKSLYEPPYWRTESLDKTAWKSIKVRADDCRVSLIAPMSWKCSTSVWSSCFGPTSLMLYAQQCIYLTDSFLNHNLCSSIRPALSSKCLLLQHTEMSVMKTETYAGHKVKFKASMQFLKCWKIQEAVVR